MSSTRPRFFFVHVMKTAGSTFLDRFRRQFPHDALWPPYQPGEEEHEEGRWQTFRHYGSLPPLLDLAPDERHRLQFVAGHFPFAAGDLLGPDDLERVTILRDPVERTLSHLGQFRRRLSELADEPLEAIYEEPWIFDRFIRDHQTRIFSMTLAEALAPRTDELFVAEVIRRLVPADAPEDERRAIEDLIGAGGLGDRATNEARARLEALGVDIAVEGAAVDAELRREPEFAMPDVAIAHLLLDATLTRPSPVDEVRSQTAIDNLARCGVVGLTEDYAGFIRELNRTYGLDCAADGRINVGDYEPWSATDSFRRRIAADNPLDVELYDAARALISRRRAAMASE